MENNQQEKQLLKTKIIFRYFINVFNNNNVVAQNYSVRKKNSYESI